MASTRVQRIRGTSLELDQDFGLEGMFAYDTDQQNIRVYDGITLGGMRILNEDQIAALYTLPERLTDDGDTAIGLSANSKVTNGWYRTDATTTDLPVAALGVLEVSVADSASGAIAQVWTRNSTGFKYFRSKLGGGAWAAWQRFVDLNFLTTDPTAKAYDADRLDGLDSTYYTDIVARLGFTPLNKAGDGVTGNLTVGGTFGVGGNAVFGGTLGVTGALTANGGINSNGIITVSGATPTLKFSDTTAGSDDFWAFVDADTFSILTDRDDDGNIEAANPLELRNTSSLGFLYGNKIITQDQLTSLGFATIASLNDRSQHAAPKRSDGTDMNIVWTGQGPLTYLMGSSDGVNMYPIAGGTYYQLSAMQFRRVSQGTGGRGAVTTPAGAVMNGMNTYTDSGEMINFYYIYLQSYCPQTGWVTFQG